MGTGAECNDQIRISSAKVLSCIVSREGVLVKRLYFFDEKGPSEQGDFIMPWKKTRRGACAEKQAQADTWGHIKLSHVPVSVMSKP